MILAVQTFRLIADVIVIPQALLFVAVARAVGVSVSAGGCSLSEIKPYEPLIHSFLVAVARAGRCQGVSWKVFILYIVMIYVDLQEWPLQDIQDRRTPPSSPSPCGRVSRC